MGRHPVIACVLNTVRHHPIMDPRRTPMGHHPVMAPPSTVRRRPVTSHQRTVIHRLPAMAHLSATVGRRARTYRLGRHPAMTCIPKTTCRRNTVHRRGLTSGHHLRGQARCTPTVCDLTDVAGWAPALARPAGLQRILHSLHARVKNESPHPEKARQRRPELVEGRRMAASTESAATTGFSARGRSSRRAGGRRG